MNTYTFEECQIGLKETFEAAVTEEKMEIFKQMSGDINPLHNDTEFAHKKGIRWKSCVWPSDSVLF